LQCLLWFVFFNGVAAIHPCSRLLAVSVNPAVVDVFAAIGARFVYFFLASLLLPMSLLLRASLLFQAPMLLQTPGKINSCPKVLFQVTFKTKWFCIAFYDSYPSKVDDLHSRTYPQMLTLHAAFKYACNTRHFVFKLFYIFFHTCISGLEAMQLSTNLKKNARLLRAYNFSTL